MWDSGATENFVPTDEDCAPGTDGPPTVSSVGVGKSGMSMQPKKSCLMPLRAPGSERIRMARVNVSDVPIRIMSEGYMKDT